MRPSGVFKRRPVLERSLLGRYARISKARWAELYLDLYRQTHGEHVTDEECMGDAEKRSGVLDCAQGRKAKARAGRERASSVEVRRAATKEGGGNG
jgi:hypothetical protein